MPSPHHPYHHHEVPTHLDVEDRVLFGLTVRQFLYLLVGSSASYGLWDQLSATPSLARIGCIGVCLLTTLAFALLRPGGRPLGARWQELAPSPVWAEPAEARPGLLEDAET